MKTFALMLIVCLLSALSGCALLFPTRAGESLAHFPEMAPEPGQPAPELEVRRLDGNKTTLADLVGDRPIVLQLGSHSCPVFRYRRFDIFRLQRDYADRVDFVVVYTTEAHPVGTVSPYRDREWLSFPNWITNTRVPQPETLDERIAQAQWSSSEMNRSDLILVDELDNATWKTYGAAPSPAFVIDTAGLIVLTQPWIEPRGIREILDQLLGDRNQP
ncbi:MAG: hypothetical protein EA370_15850 [Wenzhouxiangella sp.]|nr:MAG: hypothetical protein EA370_15850 [Wenzhouxiangella sp.]